MAKNTTDFTPQSKNTSNLTDKYSTGDKYGAFKYGAKKYSDSSKRTPTDLTLASKIASDFTRSPQTTITAGHKYGSFQYGAEQYNVTVIISRKRTDFTRLTKPTTPFTPVI